MHIIFIVINIYTPYAFVTILDDA